MKVSNIVGKVLMLIFGFLAIMIVIETIPIIGQSGMDNSAVVNVPYGNSQIQYMVNNPFVKSYAEQMTEQIVSLFFCILMFIVGLVVTISTSRKMKNSIRHKS